MIENDLIISLIYCDYLLQIPNFISLLNFKNIRLDEHIKELCI